VKTDIQRAGHHQPDRGTNEGRQVKTDIQKAGHHQPDRETNEGRQAKTERQMNWDTPDSRTPPPENRRTPLKRQLKTPTFNCLGKNGRSGNASNPIRKASATEDT